jgi:hypothetical protein
MFSKYKTDVFSDDVFLKIKNFHKDTIESSKRSRYSNEMGRYYVITRFPKDIAESVIQKAEEETGIKDLDIVYVQVIRYQIHNGEVPFLVHHVDQLYCTYILDIGIDGTVDWPLIVEGQEFPSTPNSVVFLKGELDHHSRPEYPSSSEDDFLDLIFVHLGQKGDSNVQMADKFFNLPENRFQAALDIMIPNNDPWYDFKKSQNQQTDKK